MHNQSNCIYIKYCFYLNQDSNPSYQSYTGLVELKHRNP